MKNQKVIQFRQSYLTTSKNLSKIFRSTYVKLKMFTENAMVNWKTINLVKSVAFLRRRLVLVIKAW